MTTARIILNMCKTHMGKLVSQDCPRAQKDDAELHFRIFQCWTKLNVFFLGENLNSSHCRFCVT